MKMVLPLKTIICFVGFLQYAAGDNCTDGDKDGISFCDKMAECVDSKCTCLEGYHGDGTNPSRDSLRSSGNDNIKKGCTRGWCPPSPANYGEKDPFSVLKTEFMISNYDGEVNVTSKIVWELKPDFPLDGFFYLITGEGMDRDVPGFYSSHSLNGTEFKKCSQLISGDLGNLSDADTRIICNRNCFPCRVKKYCTKRHNYLPLLKTKRSFEMDTKFWNKHMFYLLASVNLTNSNTRSSRLAVFCMNELVGKQKMEKTDARTICQNSPQPTGGDYRVGPVFNLTIYPFALDPTSNKIKLKLAWTRPLDVAENTTITEYQVILEARRYFKISIVPYAGDDGASTFEVPDPPQGTTLKVYIRAMCSPCDDKGGFQLLIEKYIPDVDACNASWEIPYCVKNATCKDNPKSSETGAICKCNVGLEGDGVNSRWNGEGCYESCNLSSLKNHRCSDEAQCSMEANKTMRCYCIPPFTGDGFREGTGCTNPSTASRLSTIATLIIVIAVAILCMAVVFFVIRKIKSSKAETLNNLGRYEAESGERHELLKSISPANCFARWEIDANNIVLLDVLGRGHFGVVYKAQIKGPDGSALTVAAKEPTHAIELEEFLAEIEKLTSVQHRNIIKVVACCLTRQNSLPLLITEYMKYGDLQKFLWKAREVGIVEKNKIYELSEADVSLICQQVAAGMEHLKKMRIIHGDLAARNILVGENLLCKISDFGLATDVYRYGLIKGRMEKKVPWQWSAPERLMEGKVPITWRSDVWSFGMLMYEVITVGSTPFPGIKREKLLGHVLAGHKMEKPESCNDFFYNIMCRCWEITPSKRPKFSELVTLFEPTKQSEAIYINLLPGNDDKMQA